MAVLLQRCATLCFAVPPCALRALCLGTQCGLLRRQRVFARAASTQGSMAVRLCDVPLLTSQSNIKPSYPTHQVGMSGVCYPDSLIGTIPNLYYYAANNPSGAPWACVWPADFLWLARRGRGGRGRMLSSSGCPCAVLAGPLAQVLEGCSCMATVALCPPLVALPCTVSRCSPRPCLQRPPLPSAARTPTPSRT